MYIHLMLQLKKQKRIKAVNNPASIDLLRRVSVVGKMNYFLSTRRLFEGA